MKRAFLCALAAMMITGTLQAAGAPMVRVKLDPAGAIVVGQSVRVEVTVLAPNFFMSSPAFPTLEIAGAVVTLPDEDALHVNETIDGQFYAGIVRSYLVVPQQGGTFTLPPARIAFKYAAVPGQSSDGFVTLPPLHFEARVPEGARTAQGVLPVARIRMVQTLDRGIGGLKAGDALTRTIEVTADHTQAMMIPPPTFDAPRGVRVYRKDPVLSDLTGDRGAFLGGRRVDVATYVFDEPGDYVLPAIELPWFNARSNTREVARAPEIDVSIAANPAKQPAIAPEAPVPTAAPQLVPRRFDWRHWVPVIAATLVLTLLLIYVVRRFYRPVRDRLAEWRRARRESEPAYFARLEAACGRNDPEAAYRALGAWIHRCGYGSIGAWCSGYGNQRLDVEVTALARRLFADTRGESWSGADLLREVQQARRLTRGAQRVRFARFELPPLNP